MDLVKYRADLAAMTDEQLDGEIDQQRRNLASYDRIYAEVREAGESPMDVTLESSQLSRSLCRLAEREQAGRAKGDYGSCPMDWPEEES